LTKIIGGETNFLMSHCTFSTKAGQNNPVQRDRAQVNGRKPSMGATWLSVTEQAIIRHTLQAVRKSACFHRHFVAKNGGFSTISTLAMTVAIMSPQTSGLVVIHLRPELSDTQLQENQPEKGSGSFRSFLYE
jgi:hypothetical protein